MDNNCDNCRHEELAQDDEPCRECVRLALLDEYFTKWEPKVEDR